MSNQKNHYNFIYSQLVPSPDDIIGVIAYSRYKQQKIEWIEKFKNTHNGVEPTSTELAPFHDFTNTPSAIVGYRLQAKEILDKWTEGSLAQANAEMFDSYNEQLNFELRNIEVRYEVATRKLLSDTNAQFKSDLKSGLPGFLSGVLQNILASVVMIVISALILIVIWSSKANPVEVIGGALGFEVKQKLENGK